MYVFKNFNLQYNYVKGQKKILKMLRALVDIFIGSSTTQPN